MDIKVTIRAEKLLEVLELDSFEPEEIHIEETRIDGEHPEVIITLIDCPPR